MPEIKPVSVCRQRQYVNMFPYVILLRVWAVEELYISSSLSVFFFLFFSWAIYLVVQYFGSICCQIQSFRLVSVIIWHAARGHKFCRKIILLDDMIHHRYGMDSNLAIIRWTIKFSSICLDFSFVFKCNLLSPHVLSSLV